MTVISNTAPAPFQTVSAVDAAEAYLRREVLIGRFEAGQRIKEAPLAASLRISRHTLRSAFARLESVGLLAYRENRGWSVPILDRAEYEDILVLRQSLESTAYRLIKERAVTPGDSIQEALQRVLDVTDDVPWPDRLELDCALHQALVDLAGSRRLSQAFEALMIEFRLCRLQSLEWLETVSLDHWKKLHSDLVDGIKHPDASVDVEAHFLANPWRDAEGESEAETAGR